MLMSISFPVIADEWVELVSLASSSRNDALSDKHVESIAKPVADCQRYFQGTCPDFAKGTGGYHWETSPW